MKYNLGDLIVYTDRISSRLQLGVFITYIEDDKSYAVISPSNAYESGTISNSVLLRDLANSSSQTAYKVVKANQLSKLVYESE